MIHEDLIDTLLSTKPFKYLNRNELEILKTYCRIIKFSNNEVLIKQGKKSEGMYIIISGKAILAVKILGKDIFNLETLTNGNFFGETSLIKKLPSAATVIASEEMTCLQLTTIYFDMLSIFFPEIRYKILKAITEEICIRLRDLHHKIINTMTESDMVSRSLLNGVMQSLVGSENVQLEQMKIQLSELKENIFFNAYTSEEIDELLHYGEFIKTRSNFLLIKEGEVHSPFFVIICGAVQSSMLSSHKIAKLSILSPMTLFGNISFIDNKPSIVNYASCERTILLKFPEEKILLLKENKINIWYKFVDSICESFVLLEASSDKLLIRLNSELYNR